MVEFKKKITQCRECPNCRIVPDPDDDDEKALCKEAGVINGSGCRCL